MIVEALRCGEVAALVGVVVAGTVGPVAGVERADPDLAAGVEDALRRLKGLMRIGEIV